MVMDSDTNLNNLLENSQQIVKECFEKYLLEEIFLSFNGGKDCTVLLDIVINVLKDIHKRNDIGAELKVVYIRTVSPFREIEDFVLEIEKFYGIKLMVVEGEMKNTLSQLLEQDGRLKACLMGSRRTDPYCKDMKYMQETDPSWPKLMRVSPLLEWSYGSIWQYILQRKVPYCCLYEIGYTSIGSTFNTQPNPALAIQSDSGASYLPAWKLQDANLERAGRLTSTQINRVPDLNGHPNDENNVRDVTTPSPTDVSCC